ncbi:4Fe-4S dicluster domain-containing protein [Legionella jordanis]|uniref:Hydrogenase subunit n=1 Tax=Legionella jordanis TaxID=456 RepID=A0A0W0VGF7_9GAMM|nr:4Fe-4S dicluster domain-containing protein [Legionella jordanis]KTD19230.1 hydrogenase subunit [Legionella jordanis]RMW99834.1 sulfite reductase subunit A [Legionella jordanis]VEH12884.1 hydrogenase subunit [Legionella jordanis]
MDGQEFFLPHEQLQQLLDVLKQDGFSCVGPQVRDGAIVFDRLDDVRQLPWGVRDEQLPGEYQLKTSELHRAFAWSNGPQAIKPILFKPRETVWQVKRNESGKLEFLPQEAMEMPVAIIGVRSCDLVAMAIQDEVFINNKYVDSRYKTRRDSLFVVAVNCSYSSKNCFCVSAGTGPEVRNPFDLLMTELQQGFVIRSGSVRGEHALRQLNLNQASSIQLQQEQQEIEQCARMQSKRIPLNNQSGLKDLLFANLNHPRWDDVAQRCLSCGNCTLVCPTCFCHSESDEPNLDGSGSQHLREWDSCFTAGHSYLAGKPIRDDIKKRYRQWLTHKVGSWFEQFDSSGCVGCGRCVTWCPVGIDITEELSAISGESNVRMIDHE